MDTALIENNIVVQVWRGVSPNEIQLLEGQAGELAEFNPGTVIAGMVWDGGNVSAPPTPVATISEVKAEAGRRIIEALPTWKQNNFIAKESELLAAENGQLRDSSGVKLPARDLTVAEIAQLAYIKSAWDWAVSIRTASDLIEISPPLITDLKTDSRWPGAFA